MRIKTIRDIDQGFEMKLSTRDKKNLNFIVNDSDEGAGLYDRITSDFLMRNQTGIEIEYAVKKRCDPRLVFVDVDMNYHNLLDYFVMMKITDQFQEISDDANDIFGAFLSEHNSTGAREFLKLEKNQIMVAKTLRAPEAMLAYYSLLVAIRKRYRIDTPLIINNLGRWGAKYSPLVVEPIAKTVPQAIIFTTSWSFENGMFNYRTRKKTPSVYDTVKKKTLGKAYMLDKKCVSKFLPFPERVRDY